MLSRPPFVARYWRCGGEVLALGGPLPLVSIDGSATPGCRPLPLEDLHRLAVWHAAEAASSDGAAQQYHLRCQADAEMVLGDSRHY